MPVHLPVWIRNPGDNSYIQTCLLKPHRGHGIYGAAGPVALHGGAPADIYRNLILLP
jgi:hypothetical protein